MRCWTLGLLWVFVAQNVCATEIAPLHTDVLKQSPVEVSFLGAQGEPIIMGRQHGYPHLILDPQNTTIAIRNTSVGRVLVVVSVNGVNPRTGKPAVLSSPGYVLEGKKTITVKKSHVARRTNELIPVFARSAPKGYVAVAVFEEDPNYPLLTGYMKAPPYGPETFARDSDGSIRWIPPSGFAFRYKTGVPKPAGTVFTNYTWNSSAAANAAADVSGLPSGLSHAPSSNMP